jgi:hypothetical protein
MMNATTTFFLRAKQWQIFALLAVLPMVAQMAFALSMPMTVRSWKEFSRVDLLFVGAMLFYMLCFLAWLWSLGSFLNSIVKPALKLRTAFFHFSAVYPAIYMPFFLAVFFDRKPSPLAVILPLHLLAIFCIFYLLRFASKTLALAETGKPLSFYAAEKEHVWELSRSGRGRSHTAADVNQAG